MTDALTSLSSTPSHLHRLAERWGLSRFIFYEKIDSTQNVARALMDSGAPAWTLVAADYQAAGRGQHGRSWFSEPGVSLMFSLMLRPASIEAAALLPIRTGLAIIAALDPFLVREARPMLKWPNDIMIADGKAGGVLCESQFRNDEAGVIVGVGLNIHRFAVEITDRPDIRPVFLAEHMHDRVDRLDLLDAIMRSFQERLNTPGDVLRDEELRAYARHDWLYGRRLGSPMSGVAAGITHEGHLRITADDGTTRDFVAGRAVLST